MLSRRVHISQTTKDSLHGEFELEPGNGGERCEYLLEKGIDTYLVLVPKQEANGNVSVLFLYPIQNKSNQLNEHFLFLLLM